MHLKNYYFKFKIKYFFGIFFLLCHMQTVRFIISQIEYYYFCHNNIILG